jgi:ribonucleoside-diphosphate reductase alpha chain
MSEKILHVTKRDGTRVPFNVENIDKVIKWGSQNITGVSVSDIAINTKLNLADGITTKEIHKVLIDASINLFNEENPNYQWVASRLLNYQIRKDVWGGKNPPRLYDFIKNNTDKNLYHPEILEKYSKAEIDKLDDKINHDRDYNFTYSGLKQLCDKYLIQNRKSKEIFETPQFAYMLAAMVSHINYSQNTRLNYVKRAYDKFSKFKINLPTPQMAGLRGLLKQYASCCLIDVDDTKESIFSSNTAAGFATTQRYGIGLNFGRIRGIGTEIKGGSVIHTGIIPFLKVFEATVKSCQQNGIRGGGATVNFPIWHYEIEDILSLKNNGGTEDNRVRKVDYVIQFSKLFYERFMKNETITLFSPHEVPELTESFGLPQFDELYIKCEADKSIKYKRKVKASALLSQFTKERTETGRYYVMNMDHCNEHGSFLERVCMTNLCVEVTHPTKPIQHIDDPEGEIGICVLSAINVLEIKDDQDLIDTCDTIVRMLDEIIDYQEYFTKAAENFTRKRRSLGVGITNLAALLAKNNLKYMDTEAPNFVDTLMEKIQYHLISSSIELAKEKGPCEKFNTTKYSQGILPIDTYKKKVDQVVTRKPSLDWEELRQKVLAHGMRHSTLTAMMPCESSSVIQNSTNGIEPPRSLLTYKGSKANSVPLLVPNYSTYKNKYTLQFDMPDNTGYINIVAAIQKWTDMAISANLYYNYDHYPNKALPDSVILKELLYAYSMGVKTLYYSNTYDGDKQSATDEGSGCAGGSCTI